MGVPNPSTITQVLTEEASLNPWYGGGVDFIRSVIEAGATSCEIGLDHMTAIVEEFDDEQEFAQRIYAAFTDVVLVWRVGSGRYSDLSESTRRPAEKVIDEFDRQEGNV